MSADRDALLAALAPLSARLSNERSECATVARDSALARIVETFSLDAFERDVLLLAAGCEIDRTFAPALVRALGEPAHALPTFGLALGALSDPVWEALAPESTLRRYRLIEPLPSTTFSGTHYRVPERVLHALLGLDVLDESLAPLVTPLDPPGLATPAHDELVATLVARWSPDAQEWPILACVGEDPGAQRAIAARVANACGLNAWALDARALPENAADCEALARIWEREAALCDRVLAVELGAEFDPAHRRLGQRLIERLRAATIVCSRERVPIVGRDTFAVDVGRPSSAEQHVLWQRVLGTSAASFNGALDRVVAQFSFDAETIARIGSEAEGDSDKLWASARQAARPQLEELATRLPCDVSWGDLVLPGPQTQALHEIVAHVRQRAQVYEAWGFGRNGRGLGVTALFAGPSGVGKTLAAEVVANELHLDCYRIDLSQVVSKYIGETEKSLRRVFDAAEGGGAILLFDEADAIFGKRTDVRDSHDRYANIEVSYLLQRMEAYRGLAILTTNMKNAIDSAFLRRLRYVVNFPFPDASQRIRIWETILPEQTPSVDLDPSRLAQLNVTGGNIRNIALHAAFIAADEGSPVSMAHMKRAARTEYAKLDRPLTDGELVGWS
jgi:hypothetical protein